jgi:hypothetical protein
MKRFRRMNAPDKVLWATKATVGVQDQYPARKRGGYSMKKSPKKMEAVTNA